jgi:pantothenate kinase
MAITLGDRFMNLALTEFDHLARRVESTLRAPSVLADEKPVAVFPRVDELRDVLIPLLDWCVGRRPSAARGIVGIAAPCGAGKTLLLSWLAATPRGLGLTQFAFAALDGYHFPNAVLDSRSGIDPEGNLVPLRLLKGTPPTFDVDSFLADLRAVKSTHQELHLPMYSRRLHEPVAGCIKVGPEVEWVFVEGNFLFLDTPPWRQVGQLLERKIYLDAPDDVLRARLRLRHAAAGRDAAWIEAHFSRTDGPNISLIRAHAHFADVFFRWGRDGHLKEVESAHSIET